MLQVVVNLLIDFSTYNETTKDIYWKKKKLDTSIKR